MTREEHAAMSENEEVLAVTLQILKRDLSPRGIRTVALMLLAHIAKAAEAGPDPVDGASVIRDIADVACGQYRSL